MLCIAPPYDSLAILALACTPNLLLVVSHYVTASPLSWGSIVTTVLSQVEVLNYFEDRFLTVR